MVHKSTNKRSMLDPLGMGYASMFESQKPKPKKKYNRVQRARMRSASAVAGAMNRAGNIAKGRWKQVGKSVKSKDSKQKARVPGFRRVKNSTSVYFENRKNRSDVPGRNV